MRLVLDTNVIISALLFDGLPEQLVLAALGGRHDLILSPYIIAEIQRILKNKFGVQLESLNLLQQLLDEGEVSYFEPFLHILADEPDNRVLETAVRGQADVIVTGDKPLLAQKTHGGIQILTIRDCLKQLS